MELQQLRCVIAIAEHGSFSRAAAALHVTQSAVSYSVSKLEHELGLELFHRGRTISVSPAGESMLGHARAAVRAADGALESVAAVTGLLAGRVDIAVVSTFIEMVARTTATYQQEHPAVVCRVFRALSDFQAIRLVREGRVDMAIARLATPADDLYVEELVADPPVLVLPPGMDEANEVDAAALRGMPMIASPVGSYTRAWVDQTLRTLGAQVRIVAECNDHVGRLELVAAGVGATICTQLAAQSFRAKLATVPWPHHADIGLSVVRRDSDGPPATIKFAKLLGDVVHRS